MIEQLKALAEKKRFTAEDKQWIIQKSKDLGLEFDPKKSCSNCWTEQIQVIYRAVKPIETIIESESDYILLPHIDAILHGVRYNNATLNEDKAKYLIGLGFSKWFLKIKSEDESNTVY